MIRLKEGDQVIVPEGVDLDDWLAQVLARRGMFERVGTTQAEVMTRAKESEFGAVMTSGEKERLAATRLEARCLLRRTFPGAGPGHPQRRFLTLTERGQECWLVVTP